MTKYHNDTDADDIDVDVCMGCGRYYGMTQSLVNRWRAVYKPRDNAVMPQECWKCLVGFADAEGK